MAWTKAKTAIAAAAGIVLAVVLRQPTTTFVVHHQRQAARDRFSARIVGNLADMPIRYGCSRNNFGAETKKQAKRSRPHHAEIEGASNIEFARRSDQATNGIRGIFTFAKIRCRNNRSRLSRIGLLRNRGQDELCHLRNQGAIFTMVGNGRASRKCRRFEMHRRSQICVQKMERGRKFLITKRPHDRSNRHESQSAPSP